MASTIFNGTSRYTQDFSAVIERSVGIASLALTQMQQSRLKSADEVNALKLIEAKVLNLQGTIKAVEEGVTTKSLQTTSSESTSVRATSADGVAGGSYTIRVTSLGSYSTAVSKTSGKPAVADPSSGSFVTAGTTKLTLRIVDHDGETPTTTDKVIDLAGGTSLQAIVDAVNEQAGSDVQAALVNVGTTASPNYALSLQSTKLGKLGIQLKEGNPPPSDTSGDLMNVDETNASDPSLGSRAEYKLNGATIQSDARTVTISPKLTADLLKADATKDITITVSQGTTSFTSAMNSFITAYNDVLDQLDNSAGEGGALVGNSLVSSVRRQLKAAVDFIAPSSEFASLSKIGIEFTSTGRLLLNASLFSDETSGKFASLKALIGTTTTSGFAKAATDALNSVESTTGGFLKDSVASLEESLKAEDNRIAAETARVEQFTQDLQQRLAEADAMIAMLEQQAEYFNNMFEAMRANQKSYS